jgi:hypothetical protein
MSKTVFLEIAFVLFIVVGVALTLVGQLLSSAFRRLRKGGGTTPPLPPAVTPDA